MHITSHNSRSVISWSLDKFPSLVGWCFLFCSVFKVEKSYTVWEYYKHSLFVLSVYQLPSALRIFLIYLMKDLSTLLALEHVTYACSKGIWMTLWRSSLWLLFCNPVLHSHKMWPEMRTRSNVVVTCSFRVVQSWLQQAAKRDPRVSDGPLSLFLCCQFTWKYEFMCIETMQWYR